MDSDIICSLCNKHFANNTNLNRHITDNTCDSLSVNPGLECEITENQHILEQLNEDFWKTTFLHWSKLLDSDNNSQLFGWKQFESKVSESQNLPVTDLTKTITEILPNIHPRHLRQKFYLCVLKSNKLNLNTKTILIHTIHKLKLFLNYNLNHPNRTWNTTKITTLLKKL